MSGHVVIAEDSEAEQALTVVALEDDVLEMLAIVDDWYGDASWSGDRLVKLRERLQARAAAERAAVRAALLEKHGTERLEPWIRPMLAAAQAAHPFLLPMERIVALAIRAEKHRGTLVFQAD